MTEAKNTEELLKALPERVRKRVEELRDSLTKVLGAELECLLVFGSAVRGGYREGVSDVDVVVVLKDASRARLEALAPALNLARASARIEAMVLQSDEIPRSADVFPLFYDDLRECHAVLAGSDPFSKLEIADRHRRLRIEQELREAQTRLRRMVVDGQGSQSMLAGAVARKVRQIRGPLQALLTLKGSPVPGGRVEEVLHAAGKLYGIDVEAALKPTEKPAEGHTALTALLSKAIHDVDTMGE